MCPGLVPTARQKIVFARIYLGGRTTPRNVFRWANLAVVSEYICVCGVLSFGLGFVGMF